MHIFTIYIASPIPIIMKVSIIVILISFIAITLSSSPTMEDKITDMIHNLQPGEEIKINDIHYYKPLTVSSTNTTMQTENPACPFYCQGNEVSACSCSTKGGLCCRDYDHGGIYYTCSLACCSEPGFYGCAVGTGCEPCSI